METAPKPEEDLYFIDKNRSNPQDADQRLDPGDNKHKGIWTEDEDWLLVEFMDLFGLQNWSYIAKLIEVKIRQQCRYRWHNHVRADIEKGPWSKEEDMILIKAHEEVGTKWSEIAKRLSRRTENSISSHWNTGKMRLNSKMAQNESNDEDLLLNYIKKTSAVQEGENEIKDSSKNNEMNKSSESDFKFKGWDSQEEDEVGRQVSWDSQEL